jgi:cupin superfamily acireductone dioxygenase involved in methionine salvage
MGGSRIILEADSLVVVSALRARDSCNRAYSQVLDDIKASFSYFSSVDVLHVCRDANRAAHVLAKFALSQLLDNT